MNAQDITNLLTLFLGIATVWLAVETRRMASAAGESLKLQLEPQLAFDGFEIEQGRVQDFQNPDAAGLKFGLKLSNPGQVRINYRMRCLKAVLDGTAYDGGGLDTSGGVIHPKMSNTFTSPVIRIPKAIQAPSSGEITFEIEFWAVRGELHVMRGSLALMFISSEPLVVNFHFLKGPEYS